MVTVKNKIFDKSAVESLGNKKRRETIPENFYVALHTSTGFKIITHPYMDEEQEYAKYDETIFEATKPYSGIDLNNLTTIWDLHNYNIYDEKKKGLSKTEWKISQNQYNQFIQYISSFEYSRKSESVLNSEIPVENESFSKKLSVGSSNDDDWKMLGPEEQQSIQKANDKEIIFGFISIFIIIIENIYYINSKSQTEGWFPFYFNFISILMAVYTLQNIDTRFVSFPILYITIAINTIFGLYCLRYWESPAGLIGLFLVALFYNRFLFEFKAIRFIGYVITPFFYFCLMVENASY